MHLGLEELAGFYDRHSGDDALVLALVIATEGSTYRKPGAMMLVAESGGYCGLISGGCLENDLVEQASRVFEDGRPRRVTYDLHDDEELVWGLGLGCGGAVHLLLRRLRQDEDYPLLEGIFDHLDRGESCWVAMSAEDRLDGFSWALAGTTDVGDARLLEWLRQWPHRPDSGPRFSKGRYAVAGDPVDVVVVRVDAAPRLLICGAGPDAVPMARLASDLGWRCVVVDHRPAFASPERFPRTCHVIQSRPNRLSETVDLSRVSAAIVMSHHVEHDATYLETLAKQPPRYLAVLGPEARRRQLEQRLGMEMGLLRGPAGLDIGAELPSSIALSVLAEIHAVLCGRSGIPLTRHA